MSNISKISSWVSSIFKSQGFDRVTVRVIGSSEKGDGYLGDVIFVEAICVKPLHTPEKFDLVVKCSKSSTSLRAELPVELVFRREIFMYETVVPVFRKLEEKHNVKLIDQFLVKCYNTVRSDDEEAVILQNANSIGYELHDRFEPLNLGHLELTFENYGRWHAFGIAYRDQHPEQFRKQFLSLENVLAAIYPAFKSLVDNVEATLYSFLETSGELEILKNLKEILQGSIYDTVMRLTKTREENCTIIHGDCWNNNFMFKYNDEEKLKPQDVLFLDFQMLGTGPPVFDLSYHLYSTASDVELNDFDYLLRKYYDSLSFTLTQLGSKSEKLFTFDQLVNQWKEHSLYGFLSALGILPLALTEKQDAIDVQKMNDSEIMEDMFVKLKEKNNTRICSRMLSITKHFLSSR